MNVPLGDLKNYVERLPKDREVVAYCRGRRFGSRVVTVRTNMLWKT